MCNNRKDYEIIHSLRSHGWDRGIKNNKKNLPTFNFINSGFNLRPTEVAAAIGLSQFRRLNKFKEIRAENKKKIIKELVTAKEWNDQFIFLNKVKNLEPSWFGFPMLLNEKFRYKKNGDYCKEIMQFINYIIGLIR